MAVQLLLKSCLCSSPKLRACFYPLRCNVHSKTTETIDELENVYNERKCFINGKLRVWWPTGAITKSTIVFLFLLYISVFCTYFCFILGRVLVLCGLYHKLNFIYSENVLFLLRFICDEFYFDTKN